MWAWGWAWAVGVATVGTVAASADITLLSPVNGGNPTVTVGATAAEALVVTATYDSGAQTLDYVTFITKAASSTADKGKMVFAVDEATVLSIVDAGITVGT